MLTTNVGYVAKLNRQMRRKGLPRLMNKMMEGAE